MSEADGKIEDYLTTVAGFRNLSFEKFVLDNGQKFVPHTTRCIWRGRMKECFKNAYYLHEKSNGALTYCEGFACHIIPVLHAWCCDEDGRVYEPTWKTLGSQYYGIPFQMRYVLQTMITRRMFGVIDNMEGGFPLLRNTPPISEWRRAIKPKPTKGG